MAKLDRTSKTSKRKVIKSVPRGRLYVTATFNNTLSTITDENGQALVWGSTGKAGFSGSRKSTPYAATVSLEKVISEAKEFGIRELKVYIKGPGPGRDAALRVLRGSGIRLTQIADVTPIPHNGTRPRKRKHNR
jgi:small subunit ribosomal protein S11